MSGIFERLFGPKKNALVCPFCLREVFLTAEEGKCPRCAREIPHIYRRDFKELPPLFAPIIGWTNAGKTMALYAMNQTLESLPALWRGFTPSVYVQETLDWLRFIRESMQTTGQLPQATKKEKESLQPSYVVAIKNLLRWRSPAVTGRTLVFRDFPGEVFSKIKIPDDYMPILTVPSTIILMYCLSDLEDRTTDTHKMRMNELLMSYIATLMNPPYQIDVRRKRPRMIVVFSQADRLLAPKRVLPSHLADYLLADPIARDLQALHGSTDPNAPRPAPWDDARVAKYVEEMERASDAIRDWVTQRHPSASALVGEAMNNKIDLRFCLVSATGAEVGQGRLLGQLNPYRILEPLFHALEFDTVSSAR